MSSSPMQVRVLARIISRGVQDSRLRSDIYLTKGEGKKVRERGEKKADKPSFLALDSRELSDRWGAK